MIDRAFLPLLCYPLCFSTQMTTYNIRIKQGGPQTALSFCDVMAIGDDDCTGLSYTDALAVLKGHVPEGYKVLDLEMHREIYLMLSILGQGLYASKSCIFGSSSREMFQSVIK